MSKKEPLLLKNVSQFFVGTTLSRFSGLVRDLVTAYAFGTKGAIGTFIVAYRFAHLLRRILSEGAMQASFIPHFEKLRKGSEEEAFIFYLALKKFLSLLLFTLSLLAFALVFFIGRTFSLEKENQELLTLTALLFPSLLFIARSGLTASYLQCQNSYFFAALSPLFINLFWMFGIFAIGGLPPFFALKCLALFVVLGAFCQNILLELKAAKTIPKLSKKRAINGLLKNTSFLTTFFLAIAGVSSTQLNAFFDALFARIASLSGPAYLWYAIRFQQLPIALFVVAVTTALLPRLSRTFKAGDTSLFDKSLLEGTKQSLFLILPSIFILYLFGYDILKAVYVRGDFTNESLKGTLSCLYGYALGLLPMTFALLFQTALFAKGQMKQTSRAAFLSVCANLALNAFFVLILHMGPASIAYATSISSLIHAALLFKELKPSSFFSQVAPAFLTYGTFSLVYSFAAYSFNMYCLRPLLIGEGIFEQIFRLAATLLLFTAFYLLSFAFWKRETPFKTLKRI